MESIAHRYVTGKLLYYTAKKFVHLYISPVSESLHCYTPWCVYARSLFMSIVHRLPETDSLYSLHNSGILYRVAQKSKPLPNYQKIVLNRTKACQW